MSINQSFAIPDKAREKQKKYGKYYSSIDFELNNDLRENDILSDLRPVIGSLEVGHYKIKLTYNECVRIAETLVDALNVHEKAYRLGTYKK